MLAPDVLAPFVRRLDGLGVRYMITGSTAGIFYGEPRMTHDVDLVVALAPRNVPAFVAAFPGEEFYCPPEEVLAVEVRRGQRGHCNLIHHETGFKADVYVACDALHRWALDRRRAVVLGELTLWLAPPEYVVLRKLEYLREGGSAKHVRDIRGIVEVTPLDRGFLDAEIAGRGLASTWAKVTGPGDGPA